MVEGPLGSLGRFAPNSCQFLKGQVEGSSFQRQGGEWDKKERERGLLSNEWRIQKQSHLEFDILRHASKHSTLVFSNLLKCLVPSFAVGLASFSMREKVLTMESFNQKISVAFFKAKKKPSTTKKHCFGP